MAEVAVRKKKRRSERGNWLVVTLVDEKIWWCTWVQTWAGVQMSRRNAERERWQFGKLNVRVMVLDIERMAGMCEIDVANETLELERLLEMEG